MRTGRGLVWPTMVTLATLIVWEQLVTALRVKTVLLPRPSLIAGVLWSQGPLILEHMWPTFYQIVVGFLLSLAGGVLVAILITYSDFVRKGFYPLIVLLQIVPKVAVAPLFVVWFGLGDLSRLLLAFLIAFFPIVINTAAGLTSVDDDFVRMARAYMGTRRQIFTKIRLPHALPLIFGGMKISITLAVIGVVVAEFVAAQRGIGYLIVMANGLLDTPLMMAAIVALSLMGLVLYGIVAGLERLVVYWHVPTETPRGGFA
jgi:NitT/TauT family transport system permease protein